jgi:hypothetical protein
MQIYSGMIYVVRARGLHRASDFLRQELGQDVTAAADVTGALGFTPHYEVKG